MKNFSKTVRSIDSSTIKQIELLAKSQKNVISFAQGIPSFFTAPHIKKAAKDAMDQNLTDKYTPGYGIEPLRVTIAAKLRRDNNIPATPSEVLVTHGATEGMMVTLMALLDPSNELLMPTPNYASHIVQTLIATTGGKPTYVPMKETADAWTLDIALLSKAISLKTKAILICNPSNPLGKMYIEGELKAIAKLAVKHDLYIIVDEMYEYLVFDGNKHVSIGSFKELKGRVISLFGVSKSYAMTGWRIGYIHAAKSIIDELYKIHDSLINCPTAVAQYAALAAITGPQDVVATYRNTYQKRRQIVLDVLAETDAASLIVPQAAYYAFIKIKRKVDDLALALDMLEKAKVGVVPGSAFGKGGENHIRISFGLEEDMLREGLQRLVNYLNKNY